MIVDDNAIYEEYHSLRLKEYIPIQKFIDDHHLKITTKKFYKGYRLWLISNNLEYPYWNSEEYLKWYGRYFHFDEITMDNCFKFLKIINNVKTNFNPLTLVTAIIIKVTGKTVREMVAVSGLSHTAIEQCMNWISDNNIKIQRETYLIIRSPSGEEVK